MPRKKTQIAGQSHSGNQAVIAGNAEGEATFGVDTRSTVLPPPHIFALCERAKRRSHAIGMQSKCDRGCDSYVARALGYHAGLPEAERKALFKRAATIRKSVEKSIEKERSRGPSGSGNHAGLAPDAADGEGHFVAVDQKAHALSDCLPIIVATIESRRCWDVIRADAERDMRSIARSLAVWPRCEQVAGFGDISLACLVAEAGNELSAYTHYYKLWKRLGLAPYKGKAVSSIKKGALSAAEWTEAGYSPMRRGRVAGDIGAPLFFAKAKNDYGAVYTSRRERTALTHPDWTPGHSDNDARRIMLKELVADVWRWWRAAEGATNGVSTVSRLPPRPLAEAAD